MDIKERLFFRGLELAVRCGEYVKKQPEGSASIIEYILSGEYLEDKEEGSASIIEYMRFRSNWSRLNGFVEGLSWLGVFSKDETEILRAISKGREDDSCSEWIQKLKEFEQGVLRELGQRLAEETEDPLPWPDLMLPFIEGLDGIDELDEPDIT